MKAKISSLKSRLFVALFVVALIIMSVPLPAMSVFAYEQKSAAIKGSIVNVREEPNTSSSVVSKLPEGRELIIIGEKKASDGYIWYQVKYVSVGEEKQGWVRSDCVNVFSSGGTAEEKPSSPSGTDPYAKVDFETFLTNQGFPETYKTKLRTLHKKYPYWKFEAQHTNLDWDKVIEAESKLGMNLTENSNPSSWKSTQTGAYDWDAGKWIALDSGNWVAASPEIIRYYMDPRNCLDETYIFQFLKQSYDPNMQTKDGMKNVTKGTFLAGTYSESGTKSYIDTLMSAAKTSGVSPYTLASMLIVEQGVNGTGKSISGKEAGYEGYYNYFNVGAYATNGMTAVQRGLWYAKGAGTGATSYNRPWNTRTKSIIGGADYYGSGYVKVGQDTLYLKKFNVQGSKPYTHQYMTNIRGAAVEGQRMSKAFSADAKNANLTFRIPVYKNMPSSACVKPSGDGSPNFMLKSLSVSGQSLTPTFDKYTTSYSVIVENKVSSVTISAAAVDGKATVSGIGKVSLKVGSNKVSVKVKAQDGSTRTYTINIVREVKEEKPVEKPEEKPVETPTLTSSVYTLNASKKTISGIKTFPVKASDFTKNLKVSNGSVKITTASGAAKTEEVGTGDQVRLYDMKGTLKATYNVVVYGDTNGDGKVDALDLLRVQKDILGVSSLKGLNMTAADTSKNGAIDALDLLQIQKQIIGAGTIKQ